MKKLFTTMMVMAMVVAMTVLSSCSGTPSNADVQEIISKYDSGEALTTTEYGTLLDYADAVVDEVRDITAKAEKVSDFKELAELQKKYDGIWEKYPHVQKAISIIENADEADLGTKGQKLLEKWENN